MKKKKLFTSTILCVAILTNVYSQSNIVSQKGITAIKIADLKKDLYEMADDHFRGREAGTLDELKASVWLAEKARAAGLKPAGDDGTYFQFFNLYRNRLANNCSVQIGGRTFEIWKDALISQTAQGSVNAPVIFVNSVSKESLDTIDVKGKAVAFQVSKDDINLDISLPHRRYLGYVSRKYGSSIIAKGAAAIIFIADDIAEDSWEENIPALKRGLYDIEGGANANVQPKVPFIWLHKKDLDLIKQQEINLSATVSIETYLYPSVNVVGIIDGTDPKLKNEYVLFSGHQDHDGIRLAYGKDSIYNGADDNGSVSVAMLAIARAFKKQPAKRSVLFVWHGAEERGLLGSKWYSTHPTVAKESIVAVLNGDMIGRNHPDSAALLGSQPPHLNSKDLVKMAMEANNEGPKFKLDTLWDKPAHVEGFYFRSDHLPYARIGIPAIFYTTVLHDEYHTPMDEAKNIDYNKLKKMTEWIYRTGVKVANTIARPKLEADFKLER